LDFDVPKFNCFFPGNRLDDVEAHALFVNTLRDNISIFPPMKWAIFILKWASGFLDGRVAYLWASEIFTRPQVGEFYIYRPSHGDFKTRRIYRVNREWAN